MTMTLQEISDRMEIGDLIVDYAMAIDGSDWDALDDLFVPDARIDYTATGGIAGSLGEIKAFLPEGLRHFTSFQHLTTTSKIVVDGDVATGRTICHNPMTLTGRDGTPQTMTVGLWYVDRFVRTPDGWRFAERSEELSYMANLPDGFTGPT